VEYEKTVILVVVNLGARALLETVLQGQGMETEYLADISQFLNRTVIEVDPQQVFLVRKENIQKRKVDVMIHGIIGMLIKIGLDHINKPSFLREGKTVR
jgi:hypothetical protein